MLRAQLYQILSRNRPADIGPTVLSDFTLGPAQDVPARMLADDPAWSLYGLDLDGGQAIFVQLPDALDLSHAVFLPILQHSAARQVLTVALSDLPALSADLPRPDRILFLFSIGRCGSTLVSNIFSQVPEVFSLSEPEAYMTLALARHTLPVTDQAALIAAVTRFAYRPPKGRPAGILALKFHSQALFQAELFHQAFPGARCLFLYRDAESWANSVYQFMQNIGFPDALDAPSFGFGWRMISAATPQDWLAQYVDLSAESFRAEDLIAPAWILHVQQYRRLLAQGLPFKALRYNELAESRAASTSALLDWAGLPASALDKAMLAFDQDSQEGTALARSDKVRAFGTENYAYLNTLLLRGPDGMSPDQILPDAPFTSASA